MSERFTVEVDRHIVGIAVRSDQGFRFFACDPDYLPLEQRRFRYAQDVERSASNLKRSAGKSMESKAEAN